MSYDVQVLGIWPASSRTHPDGEWKWRFRALSDRTLTIGCNEDSEERRPSRVQGGLHSRLSDDESEDPPKLHVSCALVQLAKSATASPVHLAILTNPHTTKRTKLGELSHQQQDLFFFLKVTLF